MVFTFLRYTICSRLQWSKQKENSFFLCFGPSLVSCFWDSRSYCIEEKFDISFCELLFANATVQSLTYVIHHSCNHVFWKDSSSRLSTKWTNNKTLTMDKWANVTFSTRVIGTFVTTDACCWLFAANSTQIRRVVIGLHLLYQYTSNVSPYRCRKNRKCTHILGCNDDVGLHFAILIWNEADIRKSEFDFRICFLNESLYEFKMVRSSSHV